MFHAVLCQTADVFNSPSQHHPRASLFTNSQLKTSIPVHRDRFLHSLDILETDLIRAKTAFHYQLRQIQAQNEVSAGNLFGEQTAEQNKQGLVDNPKHQSPFLADKEEKEKITIYDQAKRSVTESQLGKNTKANDIVESERARSSGAAAELKRKNDTGEDKVRTEQARKRQAVTVPTTVPTSTALPFNEVRPMAAVTEPEYPTTFNGVSPIPVVAEPKESNPKDPGFFDMQAAMFGVPTMSDLQFTSLVSGRSSSPLVLPASQPYLATSNGFLQYPDSVPAPVVEGEFGGVTVQQQPQHGNGFDNVDELFNC